MIEFKVFKRGGALWPVDGDDKKVFQSMDTHCAYKIKPVLPRSKLLPTDEQRRGAQNRLMWMWFTDIEKTTIETYAGRSKDNWHIYFKGKFLVPIYIRDRQDYAETWAAVAAVKKAGCEAEAKQIWRHIARETSTTLATVAQFAEYLNNINAWCLQRGIWLRTDAELYALAQIEGVL